MPFANANLLSQVQIARWLIENSPFKLQIARVWPFLGVQGGSLTYTRKNAVLTAAGTHTNCNTVVETSDTAAAVTFLIQDFITRYQICFPDQDRYRFPNDMDAVEYALALQRLIYGYFASLDTGGTGSLQTLVDPARIVDMGGVGFPLTLDCMDDAYHRVVANDGCPNVIMTSSRGVRTYNSITRAAGLDVPMVPFGCYNPATGRMEGGEVPAFNGTPILINDMMQSFGDPAPEAQRIWFMVLGDDGRAAPTRGVTGIVPEDLKGSMFIKRETSGVVSGGVVTSATDVWVSWPVGLAMGSQGALSVIQNFDPVADCSGGGDGLAIAAASRKSSRKRKQA